MMKNLRYSLVLCSVVAGILFCGRSARADLLALTISAPFQIGAPGETLAFDATVTDNDPTETLYLNEDTSTLAGSLVLDDTPFLTNFPLSMNFGDTYMGQLFTVAIPVGTTDGIYAGAFQVLGGSDDFAEDMLSSVDFNVNTISTVTPEPASLLLLLTGVVSLVGLLRGRIRINVRN